MDPGRTSLKDRPQAADAFHALAAKWHEETDDQSTSLRIVGHPAYLRIVAMGMDAVPLILADLETTEAFWYPALEAITGVNPATPEQSKKPRLLREAWLRWGRDYGFR